MYSQSHQRYLKFTVFTFMMPCHLAAWTHAQSYWVDSQDSWITTHNSLGEVMAAFSDLYVLGKAGSERNKRNVRAHLEKREFITSTLVAYDRLKARVVHHLGSAIVPATERSIDISSKLYDFHLCENVIIVDKFQAKFPGEAVQISHNSTSLDFLLKREDGLRYVQALLDTSDDAQEISRTLESLSGMDLDKIKLEKRSLREKGPHAIGLYIKKTEEMRITPIFTSGPQNYAAFAVIKDPQQVEQLEQRGGYFGRFDRRSLRPDYDHYAD